MRGERGKCLEGTATALSKWRRRFGGRGRRIPAELWADVGEVARSNGVAETARALRLDARKVAAVSTRTAATPLKEELGTTGFMEFGGVEIGARETWVQVEFLGRDGDQVRVNVPSGARDTVDVVELARAFWSRRP